MHWTICNKNLLNPWLTMECVQDIWWIFLWILKKVILENVLAMKVQITHFVFFMHKRQKKILPEYDHLACVRRGHYFVNFAKSFRTSRSESTEQDISRNISRNKVESLERVPGVSSRMAASINDAVLLKYCMFERNKCYYGFNMLLMHV